MTRLLAVSTLLAALTALTPVANAQSVRHPLDPLTRQEHFAVVEVLQAAGKVDAETGFARIALKEPEKGTVWAWTPGAPVTRAAEATVHQGANVFEAIVDLDGRRLTSWTPRPGVQPMWLEGDFGGALVSKALKDPRVIAALKKRGVENLHFVTCFVVPAGTFGEPQYAGKRIGILACRQRSGDRNSYARRIEGLGVTVDLNAKEILDVADDEVVPVPRGSREFDLAATGKLREFAAPIEVRQPAGPGFTLDGHVVTWDRWRFHVRPDARVGTVISTASWKDGDRQRPVLYQAHLSEIFVPYMDPRREWSTRAFIDAGEYAAGGLADTLQPGVDCPDTAVYMDGVIPADAGWPRDKPRVLCIYERAAGDMLWRHADQGRPLRELVVRMVAMIGNYDYVVDWRFQVDGQIRVSLGATGIVEAKMTALKDARTPGTNGPSSRGDAYGRYVEDHVVAVNHDHYFNFRLDLDVDGTTNRFVRDALVTKALPDGHARRSVWVTESAPVARELDARLTMDMHKPSLWRVASATENKVGYPTSYQLLPSHSIHTLMSPDDFARKRAGFIDHHLWVTPYSPAERYAAGDYPTLSQPGEGLPAWTKGNRSIDGADVVLWYTFGMHHVVRGEEWPVMPVLWHDFVLRPFDFHDGNPALDAGRKP